MSTLGFVCYVAGEVLNAPDPGDRGLAYGDGLFETVRVWHGRPVLWREHLARLRRGARRLAIRTDWAALQRLALQHAERIDDGVLKLILTRGSGGRGYALPQRPEPMLMIGAFAPPPPLPAAGLTLRWCQTRLALQPRLAGIKHLNRLEHVLARAEWHDSRTHEGLMRDTDGRVVCATSANLFVRVGAEWLTPPVVECGIAGTLRAWLLRHCASAREAELQPDAVQAAETVFLCNSVRGILPVRRLGRRRFAPHPALDELRDRLARQFPVFAKGHSIA